MLRSLLRRLPTRRRRPTIPEPTLFGPATVYGHHAGAYGPRRDQ
ncbi:hypothetical protein ACIBTV_27630 [Micromonospora sp. NPDC049366]